MLRDCVIPTSRVITHEWSSRSAWREKQAFPVHLMKLFSLFKPPVAPTSCHSQVCVSQGPSEPDVSYNPVPSPLFLGDMPSTRGWLAILCPSNSPTLFPYPMLFPSHKTSFPQFQINSNPLFPCHFTGPSVMESIWDGLPLFGLPFILLPN